MNIDYRVEGPLHLAGLRVVAPWEELSTRVPEAWSRLLAQVDDAKGVLDRDTLYGLSLEGEVYAVWACMIFDPAAPLPSGWERLDLPRRTYATHPYKGPRKGITAAYQALYHTLEQDHRHRDLEAHGLERYDRAKRNMGRPAGEDEPFDYEFLVPLRD